MAQNYSELQSHLNRVRWAWKRTAALQGFAAVAVECVGMFLVFSLLDYVYVMPQPVRIGALALLGAAIAFLFVRHVIRPLLREIPDEQVALYIEERQNESEGALLSATAFGKEDGKDRGAVYSYIVDNIVASAVRKAGGLELSRVLDLSKLRKYAFAAALVVVFFAIGAMRFSSFFGHRANRLLMPWQMSEEDLKSSGMLADNENKIEFQIVLDPQDRRVLRGSSLRVKAKLSRPTQDEVSIKFRTRGSADFQRLKMEDIEELNSFALRLPDVNDDLEFFVQSGQQVSENVNVTVYDRLEMKGYELTLTPPPYTHQKPTVEFGPSGDMTVLAGTRVTLRALANTPLSGGELSFDDGRKLALSADASPDHGAKGEFTAEKDGSYTVSVLSSDKQSSNPSSAFMIHVQKDEPPEASVSTPATDMAVHPDAEIEFVVKAMDDVGLDRVELVYNAAQGDMTEQRVKFDMPEAGPGEHEVATVLPLEDVKGRLQPGESLFYHVEAVDVKGQRFTSDIYMLKVRPYEIAGSFPGGPPHEHKPHAPPLDLMVFIAAAWNIHAQKDQIEKGEYDKRCEELAAKMVDESGKPKKFKKPKITALPPEKVEMVTQGDVLLEKGIHTLQGHDAAASVAELRQALALYEKAGTGLDFNDKMHAAEAAGGLPADPMKDALGFLKMETPTYSFNTPPPPQYDIKLPDYHRSIKGEEAKKLQEDAQDLERKQQQLLNEARKLAMVNEKEKKEEGPKKEGGEQKSGAEEKSAGEPKSGDQAAGEKKSGDQNPGGQKSGEQKSGDQQEGTQVAAAGQKSGEEKSGEEGKAGKQGAPHGDNKQDPKKPQNGKGGEPNETADLNERKKALEEGQKNLAAEARKLAQRVAQRVPNPDKDTREVLEHFRETTKQMEAAAAAMQEGKMQQAAARGEEARRELGRAAEKLKVSQFQDVEAAVEAAEDRGQQIAETQRKIREATKEVLDEAKKRDPKAGKEAKLNEKEMQKIRGLAKLQVDNQKAAENLEEYVGQVAKWAESANKKEAAEELKRASKTMKQEDLAGTMVTSAVTMAQQEFDDTKEAHNKLEKTMDKINEALSTANSGLAQSREQKLKRALNEAKALVAKAQELGGLKPEDKGGEKTGDKQEGKGGEQKSGADQQAGKTNTGKSGEGEEKSGKNDPNAQTADAGKSNDPHGEGKSGEGKSGAPKGEHKSGDDKGDKGEKGERAEAKSGKPEDNKTPMTEEDKRQARASLQRSSARLAKRMEDDKLADAPIRAQLLGAMGDEKSFDEMFREGQKTKLDAYLKSLKAVSSHLEDKLENALKAKRLSASQREQTPSQYRDLVNRYYEQLAKE